MSPVSRRSVDLACVVLLAAMVAGPASIRSSFARDDETNRFCVIPVAGGSPTEADRWQALRIVGEPFDIPGLPGPVFTPTNRGGQWTIDTERRLVPYAGPFPHSYQDKRHFVVEPWSGRTVAVGLGVSVIAPGDQKFRSVELPNSARRAPMDGPFLLPRANTTLVTVRGQAYTVEDHDLRPWFSADQLRAQRVAGISSAHDSPTLHATVIVDTERYVHVLTDDGVWDTKVAQLGERDTGLSAIDLPNASAIVLKTDRSILGIKRSRGSGFVADMLLQREPGPDYGFFYSNIFKTVMRHKTGHLFSPSSRWQRLDASGWEDVPGGGFTIPDRRAGPSWWSRDLSTIRKTMVSGYDGLFLFDGDSFSRVPDSGSGRLGRYVRVFDLPSIGRVLLSSDMGVFELTPEGTLKQIDVPFSVGPSSAPKFADWPHAGVAVVATMDGLFTMTRDLNAVAVNGGNLSGIPALGDFSLGQHATSGELMVVSDRGLLLVADTARGGAQACAEADQIRRSIPLSNVCLRPVEGSDAAMLGPGTGRIIDSPNGRGLLIDTSTGLFQLPNDGPVTPIQPRTGSFTRDLFSLPWSGDVLAGGSLNTIVKSDLSLQVLSDGEYSKVSAVLPSLRMALIRTGHDNGPIRVLRQSGNGYKIETSDLAKLSLGTLVDVPWFSAVLSFDRGAVSSLTADGRLEPFLVKNMPDVSPFRFSFQGQYGTPSVIALPRFQAILAWQDGWGLITPDRRWVKVSGLPASILRHVDAGQGDIVFGTMEGVFALSSTGAVRRLRDDRGLPQGNVRAIARSASGGLLLGGDEGLFEVDTELTEVRQVVNGSARSIGAVYTIVDAAFADLSFIATSIDTYSMSKDKTLRRVEAMGPLKGFSNLRAFVNASRVVASRPARSGPELFEIGMNNAAAGCNGLDRRTAP